MRHANGRRLIHPEQEAEIVGHAQRMREAGNPIGGIARLLNVGYDWLRRRLDNEYREKHNARTHERLFFGKPKGAPRTFIHTVLVDEVNLTKEEIRARVPIDTRTIAQRLMGDPIFERSALYQKMRGQA